MTTTRCASRTATSLLLFTLLATAATACNRAEAPPSATPSGPDRAMTDSQKTAVADAAKEVAVRVIAYSNKLDFATALKDYSPDADARYVENGVLLSYDALKKVYLTDLGPTLEVCENTVDAWDVTVLGPDAASVTVPIHLRIKAKGGPEIKNHPYVWSAVIQRRGGRWQVVQTHESHVDYERLVAALTPPPASPPPKQ